MSDRIVFPNRAILDQADILQPDNFTRVTGLTSAAIVSTLFFNNLAQPWSLVDGTLVTDAQIASGTVYWNEITGQPGFYSVRFRPNAVGFWRLNLAYAAGSRLVTLGYDVVPEPPVVATGLKASFVNTGG